MHHWIYWLLLLLQCLGPLQVAMVMLPLAVTHTLATGQTQPSWITGDSEEHFWSELCAKTARNKRNCNTLGQNLVVGTCWNSCCTWQIAVMGCVLTWRCFVWMTWWTGQLMILILCLSVGLCSSESGMSRWRCSDHNSCRPHFVRWWFADDPSKQSCKLSDPIRVARPELLYELMQFPWRWPRSSSDYWLFPKPPGLATFYRHKCPIHDCFPSRSRAVWRFGPTNSDSDHVCFRTWGHLLREQGFQRPKDEFWVSRWSFFSNPFLHLGIPLQQ